jgi:hypothetical protein
MRDISGESLGNSILGRNRIKPVARQNNQPELMNLINDVRAVWALLNVACLMTMVLISVPRKAQDTERSRSTLGLSFNCYEL